MKTNLNSDLKIAQTDSELALLNLKISSEELNKILDMQKQVEEFKGNFIKQIEFFELPFSWFDSLSEVIIQRDGLNVEYFIEDDDLADTVFLPWEYFDNKNEYIKRLNDEFERKHKEDNKKALEQRLIMAQQELEEAKRLAEAYQKTFGDIE